MADEPRMYGTRLGEALRFAAEAHAAHTRKGKDEPYVSHVLMVAALVAHYGGDEDQIIAGALHDAVEDAGGMEMAGRIRDEFGERVADIVLDCSDATPAPGETKAPWRERKEQYLEAVRQPDEHGARLVEACDKVANLRDIVEDVEREGPAALEKFNGRRDGTLWYYETLADVLLPGLGTEQAALVGEYRALLKRLLAAAS
jgi:(p)ppGpp synthase/HD superfamily hydrolase